MKKPLLCLLLAAPFAVATPIPGDSSIDVTFSLSDATSGSVLTGLTDGNLSDFQGKVVLLAYYTPW